MRSASNLTQPFVVRSFVATTALFAGPALVAAVQCASRKIKVAGHVLQPRPPPLPISLAPSRRSRTSAQLSLCSLINDNSCRIYHFGLYNDDLEIEYPTHKSDQFSPSAFPHPQTIRAFPSSRKHDPATSARSRSAFSTIGQKSCAITLTTNTCPHTSAQDLAIRLIAPMLLGHQR